VKKAGAIIAGLLIAFVGQFLALGMAGAGHGWITPFWVSLILWVAYPKVLVRSFRVPDQRTMGVELVTLFAALAGDAILVLMTLEEGVEYFEKIVRIEESVSAVLWIGSWIAIWLGWQLIALLNLVRPLARRVV